MEVKLLEIRDRATCIMAMAVGLTVPDAYNSGRREAWILRRAGFGQHEIAHDSAEPYVILCRLGNIESQYDPFGWLDSRTMRRAHCWIIEHWREIKSGEVIDIEFILGESTEKKVSEQYDQKI